MARCPRCRLRYNPSSPADQARHRRVHDWTLNGLRCRPSRSERVVLAEKDDRIAVVTADSSLPQRKRAVWIFRLASREMGYTGYGYSLAEPAEHESHAFLLYRAQRLSGLFLFARRPWVWGEWTEEEPNGLADNSGWVRRSRYPEPEPAWSVDFFWIAPNQRKRGMAAIVLGAAADCLGEAPEAFSWLPPFTALGKPFIRRLHPGLFKVAR